MFSQSVHIWTLTLMPAPDPAAAINPAALGRVKYTGLTRRNPILGVQQLHFGLGGGQGPHDGGAGWPGRADLDLQMPFRLAIKRHIAQPVDFP